MGSAKTPFFIRPAHPDDLSAVMELLRFRGSGLTSLPYDPHVIANKLAASWQLLTESNHNDDHKLLFVLSDPSDETIAGITGIAPRVGVRRPSWHFEVDTIDREAPSLGMVATRDVLTLSDACTGTSEVGSLLLHPEWRGSGYGGLLTGCRYLFIADHRAWFADTTIAQMRGVSDADGRSPFWDAVGKNFFPLTFTEADRLSGLSQDDWVPELVPQHPIYVDLLPPAAREVIGKVHANTKPARHLLEAEGFVATPSVDLFDGGPVLACATDGIRSVAQAATRRVHVAAPQHIDGHALIAHGRGRHFRCARLPVQYLGEEIIMSRCYARLLGVRNGSQVRVAPPRLKQMVA